MNPLVSEWIDKAEGDITTARRELRARKNPNYDAACFHAQQCAEKYLKAYLQYYDVSFPKTHNLIELLRLCVSVEPMLEQQRQALTQLDAYAVRYRYPGDSAIKEDAQKAVASSQSFRHLMRIKLGLT
jgi:HEPN domain-containing protein